MDTGGVIGYLHAFFSGCNVRNSGRNILERGCWCFLERLKDGEFLKPQMVLFLGPRGDFVFVSRNLVGALQSMADRSWSLRSFALNAEHTTAQVQARLLDIMILAMMGFVVMGCGRYCLVAYKEDDPDFISCCNRPAF